MASLRRILLAGQPSQKGSGVAGDDTATDNHDDDDAANDNVNGNDEDKVEIEVREGETSFEQFLEVGFLRRDARAHARTHARTHPRTHAHCRSMG